MLELLARQYGWDLISGVDSRIFQLLPASVDRTRPHLRARNSMKPATMMSESSGFTAR